MVDLAWLEAEWSDLCKRLSVSQDLANIWFKKVSNLYSESTRAYHTLQHVETMLRLWVEYKSDLTQPDVVALAIWFHDVVYDPKAKDNEAQSVVLLRQFGEEVDLPTATVVAVDGMIMTTVSHKSEEGLEATETDLHYFLDFDLAILGQEETTYAEYAAQIRREYAHVPDDAFRTGRTAVLTGLAEGRSPSLTCPPSPMTAPPTTARVLALRASTHAPSCQPFTPHATSAYLSP